MKPFHTICAIIVAALWGGNYVASKFGMETFPPFFYTALRFTVVALVLAPFAPIPPRRLWMPIVSVAFVLCVMHMALMIFALNMGLNVAGCAILAQLGVPFSCLLGVMVFGDRIGIWRASGLIISLAGTVVIAGNPNVLDHPAAFLIALVGAFMWSLSNVQIKNIKGISVFQLLAWQSVAAVPMLLVISYFMEGPLFGRLFTAPPEAWMAVAYTALGSSVAAYGMWSWLIRDFEISKVAPYSLLAPFFSVAFAQYAFGEPLSTQLIVGGILTIVGVGIITFRRPKLAAMGESI